MYTAGNIDELEELKNELKLIRTEKLKGNIIRSRTQF